MDSKEIERYREKLEKLWDDKGYCRSCGWHACLYEHNVEDWEIQDAIEKNDGILELSCVSKNAFDPSSHRVIKIYLGDNHDQ